MESETKKVYRCSICNDSKVERKKAMCKACTTLDNKIKAFAQKHPKAAGVYFEKVAKETGKLSRGRYMAKPLTPSPKKLATSIS